MLEPGVHHYAPKLLRDVVRYETRAINHNKEFHFHAKEGGSVAVEAEKKRQELENSTIADQLLQLRSIEFSADALKSNSKVIITDGKMPIILGSSGIKITK